MKPYFSIIIPLYNKANYIAQTLDSVLDQTFNEYEIIVINDGSTDHSLEVVETYKDPRINIFSTKNQGVSAARNFGIKKSQAHYIAFLDADDFWEKEFLNSIYELISANEKEHVFATALKIKTETNAYLAQYKNLNIALEDYGSINYFKSSIGHSILHCANTVFSNEAIEKIGFFDETLNTNEDTDYWIRIGLKYPVVFLNKPLATHRFVEDGLTISNKSKYSPIDFNKYIHLSKNNSGALRYLNKNMYSSIIKLTLLGDLKNCNKLKEIINVDYLSLKQKIIISLPKPLLKTVVTIYNSFSNKKNYY